MFPIDVSQKVWNERTTGWQKDEPQDVCNGAGRRGSGRWLRPAIGGIGNTTWQHGAQVDNVTELQVVTGKGELITCSETIEPNLFDAALAGQGQCCIITRATLELLPAPQRARTFALFYPSLTLGAISADLSLIREDGRFDGANMVIVPGFPQIPGVPPPFIQAVKYYDEGSPPDDAQLLAGLSFAPSPPFPPPQASDVSYGEYILNRFPGISDGKRPVFSAMVPESAANGYLAEMIPLLSPQAPGEQMFLQTFSWNTNRFTRPLLRKVTTEPVGVGIVFLRVAPIGTSDVRVNEMLTQNRTAFDQCRNIFGALYPFSAVALTPADWAGHYGEAFQLLQSAKIAYDPDNVFASGPDIFTGTYAQ